MALKNIKNIIIKDFGKLVYIVYKGLFMESLLHNLFIG